MIEYLLYRYDAFSDGVEFLCFKHEDESVVVSEALKRSAVDHQHTYRLQKMVDNEVMYRGFRFFQDGKEFTNDIANALMDIFHNYK